MKKRETAHSISLFSGIGGFEFGMREVGFKFHANLEFDADCALTLNSNVQTALEHEIRPLDITVTRPEDFYSGQVDYIVGGPPCQSFSAAGRRAGGVPGIEDARGTLFWYYCQYVSHFKPKAFVFENVRGILSSKGGEDFKLICHSFKQVGYDLYWRVLNSADYGVPQLRERLYLVGVRDDLNIEFKFPRPTHGPDSPNKTPYVTANDTIGDLDDPLENVPPYGGKYGHLIPEIPEGENYRHFTEEMGYPNPQFAWRSKFSGFLYKMAKNEPCRTIVSQQSRYDGPLHWKNRKCTTRELKRLQGFPDEMQIPHSNVVAVKQIGNSVTPPVANAIGRALRYQIDNCTEFEVPLLETNEKLTFDSRKGLRARSSRGKKTTTYEKISSPSLFEDEETPFELVFDNPSSEEMIGNLSVSNFEHGQFRGLQIKGNNQEAVGSWFTLYLDFKGEFGKRIKGISVKGTEIDDTCEALRITWALIHRLVSSISSYESLHPLWGHFTEPYPKFTISFESSGNNLALNLQEFAIIRATDKSPIPDEFLRRKFGSVQAVIDVGASIGLDIRTNATNRTVKEGEIRICYPFASYTN